MALQCEGKKTRLSHKHNTEKYSCSRKQRHPDNANSRTVKSRSSQTKKAGSPNFIRSSLPKKDYSIGGSPIRFDNFDLTDINNKAKVLDIRTTLKEKLTLTYIGVAIDSSSASFIPALDFILTNIEVIHSKWNAISKKIQHMLVFTL
ncbi:hypothetical protein F4703DRAFT_1914076 [Phycomyces blakesleeanus]